MLSAQQSLTDLTPLGLGTSHLSSLGSAISRTDAYHLINTALNLGIRVIDTADTYGSGDAERTIGNAIHGHRHRAFLITKAGFPYVALPALFSPINQVGKKMLQKTSARKNYSKQYLVRSLQRSLKRLRVESVNAFLLHEPSANELTQESWEALYEIRSSGMAASVGISSSDVDVVRLGLASGTLDLLETSVALGAATCGPILDLCAEHGVPVIGNQVLQPLATSYTARSEVQSLSTADPVSLLLTHAAARPAVRTVLVGTRNITHLRSNLESMVHADSLRPLFRELEKVFTCS